MYTKQQVREAITSTSLAETSKATGLKSSALSNLRHTYKKFVMGDERRLRKVFPKMVGIFTELRDEGYKAPEKLKKGKKSQWQILHMKHGEIISNKRDNFEMLDMAFNEFRDKLADICVDIILERSKESVEKAYREGRAKGAQEEQAKFVEEGKKTNFAETLRRRLMGEV